MGLLNIIHHLVLFIICDLVLIIMVIWYGYESLILLFGIIMVVRKFGIIKVVRYYYRNVGIAYKLGILWYYLVAFCCSFLMQQ